MKRKLSLLLALFLLFSMTGCKAATPSNSPLPDGSNNQIEQKRYEENIIGPKDAFNPLTGEYNLAKERSRQRPYAVSINNIRQSWPQSGIADADILFEIETEGGITRMMAVFSDLRELEKVGGVRSARDHMMEAVAFLDPVYINVGRSYPATYSVEMFGLDELDFDNEAVNRILYRFDEERNMLYVQEHCWYIDGTKIDRAMREAGIAHESEYTKTAFPFSSESNLLSPADGSAERIRFQFSVNNYSNYDGDLRYDMHTGEYIKFQGEDLQFDARMFPACPAAIMTEKDKLLSFKNVLVLFADISDKKEPYWDLTNVVYQNGGTGYWLSEGHYEMFD